MGIGCGSEGAKTLLQSACSIAFRCRQYVHEVAGCFLVFLVLERHIEIGGGPEHLQERPQCKALTPVLLKTEIDPAVLDAGSGLLRCASYCLNRANVQKIGSLLSELGLRRRVRKSAVMNSNDQTAHRGWCRTLLRGSAILLAVIVYSEGAAQAQAQGPVSAQSRWEQMSDCAKERMPEDRHACVDEIFRHAGLLDPVREAEIQREEFGRARRDNDAPTSIAAADMTAPTGVTSIQADELAYAAVTPPAEIDSIETQIASARIDGLRKLTVVTNEGAIWRQTDDGRIRRLPRKGESFVASEAAFGGYRCTYNDSFSFRCERRD